MDFETQKIRDAMDRAVMEAIAQSNFDDDRAAVACVSACARALWRFLHPELVSAALHMYGNAMAEMYELENERERHTPVKTQQAALN